MEILPSIVEKYTFHTDADNVVKGGYLISELIKEEENKRKKMGGSLDNPIGFSRFENLAVPIGLVRLHESDFSYMNGGKPRTSKYTTKKTRKTGFLSMFSTKKTKK